MTKELLEAYENLNKSMQAFQNEYAKAMITMQVAAKEVKALGEELEKHKQTFKQDEADFEAYKETIVESAVQDYKDETEEECAVRHVAEKNQNGG